MDYYCKVKLLSILFLFINLQVFAQADTAKHKSPTPIQLQASVGYGFPSILRFLTKFEFMRYVYDTRGYGPIHSKLDLIYKKRYAVGFSGFYNNFYTKYRRSVDTLHYVYKDFSLQARGNILLVSNPKTQIYLGAGVGRIWLDNKTYSVAMTNNLPDTLLQTTLIKSFDPTTLEATAGYRRWLTKRLGVYSELGIGRTITAFTKDGAIDSYIQAGLSWLIISNNNQRKK